MRCECVIMNRKEGEDQREWVKRWMCQFHWMQTDYYQRKLPVEQRAFVPAPHLVEPVTVVFTDAERFESESKHTLGSWILHIMKWFIRERKKRPREWVLMDNDDYQQLVQLADYRTTDRQI